MGRLDSIGWMVGWLVGVVGVIVFMGEEGTGDVGGEKTLDEVIMLYRNPCSRKKIRAAQRIHAA